jgi:small subunit ribosomal protein S17
MSDENTNESENATEPTDAAPVDEAAQEAVEHTAEVDVAADSEDVPVAEAELEEDAGAAPAEEAPADEVAADAAAAPAHPAKKKRKRVPRPLRRQRTKAKREKSAERKPITRLPKPERARGRRQERQGMVVSASADKTIVVRVDVAKVHPIYKKVVKRSTRFHAHDEENQAKVGDVVRIVETRPLSRLKRWRLQEIVEAAK